MTRGQASVAASFIHGSLNGLTSGECISGCEYLTCLLQEFQVYYTYFNYSSYSVNDVNLTMQNTPTSPQQRDGGKVAKVFILPFEQVQY